MRLGRNKEEKSFFEMIGNYLLQQKQKQVIGSNEKMF